MNRREFVKLVIGATACMAAPVMLLAAEESVAGWRFGVWELIDHYGIRHGQNITGVAVIVALKEWSAFGNS